MTQQVGKVEQFKEEASRAGAKLQELAELQDTAPFIVNLARQHGVNRVVISSSPLAELAGLQHRLEKEGITVTVVTASDSEATQQRLRQACVEADIGISEATTAISETGTLVIAGDDGSSRLVAVLPRFHITLVDCQNIVATMEEAIAKIKSVGSSPAKCVPTYVTYITGRNTTADIPGAILARAQGPAEEHILLLDHQRTR